MTTTINASPSNGLVQSADGSGILKVQSNGVTTNALAWVNFDGSTNTIRSAYNVGSITKNSTGDYTLNFTNALSNANYSVLGFTTNLNTATNHDFSMLLQGTYNGGATLKTTTQVRVNTATISSATALDAVDASVAIFGN